MDTIRINFIGFWKGFTPERSIIYKILSKHYNVIITNSPDYTICSIFGNPYEYTKYSSIRIMHVGENYVPDFNLIDYSISRYPIKFYDRNFYLPGCADFVDDRFWQLQYKSRCYDTVFLDNKEYFADFIYGHDSEFNRRSQFFEALSKYKRVESAGSFMNNMADKKTVSFLNGSKLDLQRKSKFSICFEGSERNHIITEKISDAFLADSIPIYLGCNDINKIFNKNAFINCKDYKNFDDVIERVIELDNDNKAYLDMLNQPIFNEQDYPQKLYEQLEEYVLHIFEQPIEKAIRRSVIGFPDYYNKVIRKRFTNAYRELAFEIKNRIKSL